MHSDRLTFSCIVPRKCHIAFVESAEINFMSVLKFISGVFDLLKALHNQCSSFDHVLSTEEALFLSC